MNPCIGDRQLEPDEDLECELCNGFKAILMPFYGDVFCSDEWHEVPCPDCQHDSDPGEPQPTRTKINDLHYRMVQRINYHGSNPLPVLPQRQAT